MRCRLRACVIAIIFKYRHMVLLNCFCFSGRLEVEKWKKYKKIYRLQEYYMGLFDSFKSMNDTFRKQRFFLFPVFCLVFPNLFKA